MTGNPFKALCKAFLLAFFAVTTLPGPAGIAFPETLRSEAARSARGCSFVSLNGKCLCPFCAAVNLTFTEQIAGNDVVVVAKLTEAAEPMQADAMELPTAELEITEVVKGSSFVKAGMKFRATLVGSYELGQAFLVMGVEPPNMIWSQPLKASPRVIEYVNKLEQLPPGGGKRLEFFQDYFEDLEPVLAFDAYDEFARASYAELIEMKDQIRRDKLLAWIQNPDIAVNRRRLYFTLLGVCGGPKDADMLEGLIRSGDRQKQAGLDALVGCYLVLKGEAGLPLIEEQLLANKDVDYVDTLSAVSAIRFMGSESKQIPRERLSQSLRTLLTRPELADMIIPDLARWEDWTVIDRLVELFHEAKGETVWVRVAVFQYLKECPLPEAKKVHDELAKLDPKAFERASFFSDFGFSDSPSGTDAQSDTSPDATATGESDGAASTPPSAAEPAKPAGSGGDGGTGSGSGSDGVEVSAAGSADPMSLNQESPAETNESMTSEALLSPVTVGRVPVDGEPAVPTEAADDPGRDDSMSSGVPAGIEKAMDTAVLGAQSDPEPTRLLKPAFPEPAADPTSTGEVVSIADQFPVADTRQERPAKVSATPAERPVSRIYSLTLPVVSGMAIFFLLWSVINGWFERLIF